MPGKSSRREKLDPRQAHAKKNGKQASVATSLRMSAADLSAGASAIPQGATR